MANGLVLFFSSTFYYIEAATNDKVQSFLDALWWGYATATTVGYGDIIPVTPTGKILGIILMVSGTALFATYTALFANAILEDEMIKFNIYPKKKSTDDILKMLDKHKRDLEEHISDLNAQNNSDT
jgi:voltage-gated potassium channel